MSRCGGELGGGELAMGETGRHRLQHFAKVDGVTSILVFVTISV